MKVAILMLAVTALAVQTPAQQPKQPAPPRDGIPAAHATELAVFATAAIEGAIVLARVRRDLTPLDRVHRQLRNCLLAAAPERKPRDDR